MDVRVLFDLDEDVMDIVWSGAAKGEKKAIEIDDGEFDAMRVQSVSEAWGKDDFVAVDYITVRAH